MNKRRAAANASAEWGWGTDDSAQAPFPSPRPVKAPAEQLSSSLGIRDVNYVAGKHALAVIDSNLDWFPEKRRQGSSKS